MTEVPRATIDFLDLAMAQKYDPSNWLVSYEQWSFYIIFMFPTWYPYFWAIPIESNWTGQLVRIVIGTLSAQNCLGAWLSHLTVKLRIRQVPQIWQDLAGCQGWSVVFQSCHFCQQNREVRCFGTNWNIDLFFFPAVRLTWYVFLCFDPSMLMFTAIVTWKRIDVFTQLYSHVAYKRTYHTHTL